jgi:hypothetical protein
MSSGKERVMGFREKSLAAQVAAILVVYIYYGLRLWGKPLTPISATATLIGITILMILILIAAHIAIRFFSRPELPDERDHVIALRGSRNGYNVLVAGVWCVLLLSIIHAPYGYLFLAINAAVALAELVRLGSQLFYYRFAV